MIDTTEGNFGNINTRLRGTLNAPPAYRLLAQLEAIHSELEF